MRRYLRLFYASFRVWCFYALVQIGRLIRLFFKVIHSLVQAPRLIRRLIRRSYMDLGIWSFFRRANRSLQRAARSFRRFFRNSNRYLEQVWRWNNESAASTANRRHLEQAQRWHEEAVDLAATGRPVLAGLLFQQALTTFSTLLSNNHPNFAKFHIDLGNFLANSRHDFDGAEELYRKALAVYEATLPNEHPDLVAIRTKLANLPSDRSEHAEVMALVDWGLRACEDPYAIPPRFNFSDSLDAKEQQYRWRLGKLESRLPHDHSDVAEVRVKLANVLMEKGDLVKAEELCRTALTVFESVLENTSPDLAIIRGNLADILMKKGDSVGAEMLYRQALAVFEATYPDDAPVLASSRFKLGDLLRSKGSIAEAEALRQKGMAAIENTYSYLPSSIVTEIKKNGGTLSPELYDYWTLVELEVVFKKKLIAEEAESPPNKLRLGEICDELSKIISAKGDFARAETMMRKALPLLETILDDRHPDWPDFWYRFSVLLLANGSFDEACDAVRKTNQAIDRSALSWLEDLVESDRISSIRRGSMALDIHLTVALLGKIPARETVNLLCRRKAINTEINFLRRSAVGRSADPEIHDLNKRLSEATERLSILLRDRSAAAAEWEANAKYLQKEVQSLERALAAQLPSLDLGLKLHAADCDAVIAALPPGSMLVEFTRFKKIHLREDSTQPAGEQWYVALVLRAGELEEPVLIDLGPADRIDNLVAELIGIMGGTATQAQPAEDPPERGPRLVRRTAAPYAKIVRQLRECLLEPLQVAFGSCTEVFIAPDGALNLIPFDLLLEDDTKAVSGYTFHYLTTARDLLRFAPGQTAESVAPPLVIAGPDFDSGLTGDAAQPAASSEDVDDTPKRLRGLGLRFGRLPGAEVEGQIVAQRLGVISMTGAAATETVLREAVGPRVLHIATHGYYLPRPHETPDDTLAMSEMHRLGVSVTSAPFFPNPVP